MKEDDEVYEDELNEEYHAESNEEDGELEDEELEEVYSEEDEEDDNWEEDEEEKDDESDMVIDASDLMRDYFLSYPHIKNYLEEGEYIPREIEVRIRRAYALLQAYLSAEKGITPEKVDQEITLHEAIFGAQIKAKELYKFFSFEKVSKLPKISKEDIADALDQIKDFVINSENYNEVSKYCKDLRLKAFRLQALRKLMSLRLEADEILSPLTKLLSKNAVGRSAGDLQFQAYLDLYHWPIKKANSTLTKLIITLMGSVFKKTFSKQELMENYGFPSETEQDLYDLHVLDLWKKHDF